MLTALVSDPLPSWDLHHSTGRLMTHLFFFKTFVQNGEYFDK